LVELLVVIAIIGVLVALLLPAVPWEPYRSLPRRLTFASMVAIRSDPRLARAASSTITRFSWSIATRCQESIWLPSPDR
jgi:hypothetical protein